jgi:hypothetical protein
VSRKDEAPAAPAPAPPGKRPSAFKRARVWLKDNHGKLFWVHSLYALGLGAFVATFAAKGFAHARWLVLMLVCAWAAILIIFRFSGAGKERQFDSTGHRVTYLVMTYVLKNLYQGMLFFLLPIYYKTAVMEGPAVWFFGVLAAVAFPSTMDVIFDNVLMKWRPIASFFYMLALFAVINLSIPALVPEAAAVYVTLWAGGLATFAFFNDARAAQAAARGPALDRRSPRRRRPGRRRRLPRPPRHPPGADVPLLGRRRPGGPPRRPPRPQGHRAPPLQAQRDVRRDRRRRARRSSPTAASPSRAPSSTAPSSTRCAP